MLGLQYFSHQRGGNQILTLIVPIATKVVCFSCLLKCLRSLYGKQCGLRSDCSYRSSLFWVHAVCFYTYFVSNARQLFAADDFSRQHFQMHFFLGTLRVKSHLLRFINSPFNNISTLMNQCSVKAVLLWLLTHKISHIVGIWWVIVLGN